MPWVLKSSPRLARPLVGWVLSGLVLAIIPVESVQALIEKHQYGIILSIQARMVGHAPTGRPETGFASPAAVAVDARNRGLCCDRSSPNASWSSEF